MAKCRAYIFLIIFTLCLIEIIPAKYTDLESSVKVGAANDGPIVLTFYEQLQQNAELAHAKRRQIRTNNTEHLANAMTGNSFPLKTTIQTTILESYEMSLIEEIFHDAIEEVFLEIPLAELSLKLWRVYLFGYATANSFETMVRSQLILYALYKSNRQIDYEYLLQTAFILSKIELKKQYKYLDNILKQRLANMINDLPSTLQYLFFKPTFCLMNKLTSEMLTNSEVVAEGNPIGRQTYGFSYKKKPCWIDEMSGAIRKSSLDYDNGLITDLHLMLISRDMIYVKTTDPSSQFLVASAGEVFDDPNYNLWKIEMLGEDNLVLKTHYDEYICMSPAGYNSDYRWINVIAESKNSSKTWLECQWSAGLCDRSHECSDL